MRVRADASSTPLSLCPTSSPFRLARLINRTGEKRLLRMFVCALDAQPYQSSSDAADRCMSRGIRGIEVGCLGLGLVVVSEAMCGASQCFH